MEIIKVKGVNIPEEKSALFCTKTGKFVNIGDTIFSERHNETVVVTGWRAPMSPSSTGRIHVKDEKGESREYFPSVYDCIIVDFSKSNYALYDCEGKRVVKLGDCVKGYSIRCINEPLHSASSGEIWGKSRDGKEFSGYPETLGLTFLKKEVK